MILDLKLRPAGFIQKAHGTNGAVLVRTENTDHKNISEGNWVFLNIREKPVPFFIASARPYSSHDLIVKFDGISSIEEAETYGGTEISIEIKKGSVEEEADDLYAFKAFSIIDSNSGEKIGKISGIINSGKNFHFELEDGILIPAHFDLIENVNYRTRSLTMNLPEGLLELN